jgi:hypothetical protein
MTRFLDRYLRGEYVQVWDELQALGEAVRDEPLYSDARAVAHETMRRVRANLELLVPRLRAAGYDFGYGWLAADAEWEEQHHTPPTPDEVQQMRDMGLNEELLQEIAEQSGDESVWKYELARQPHVALQSPTPDSQEQLHELERLVGPLPLSVLAWYEEVGAVNFVGVEPEWWGGPRMLIPAGDGPVYRLERDVVQPSQSGANATTDGSAYHYRPVPRTAVHDAAVERIEGLAQTAGAQHNLDPLAVYSLDEVLRAVRRQVAHPIPGRDAYYLDLAPDEYFKYFVSGGGPYGIRVPDARVDAPLEGEWHQTTFVNYLRICLQWVGFPGLAFRIDAHSADLARLREGLAPM